MPREYKQHEKVWITTRDSKTPDSALHTERDDPLFSSLKPLFDGVHTKVDFGGIAANHSVKPEEVFLDLQENYGYICIGTGENPAKGEKLTAEEVAQRKQKIKDALEAAHIPHILIRGKYMGCEEDSFFIPFNDKTIGLAGVLQGERVKQIIKMGDDNNQDSVLICQGGRACYVYTSGPQKGCVITGNSTVVYPSIDQLPDDCFSLFIDEDGNGSIGFTCLLDFNKTYSSIEQFVAEENGKLQQHHKDFIIAPVEPSISGETKHKQVFMTRGTNGLNEYAVALKVKLEQEGKKVAIFGTDANIAKINVELADPNSEISKVVKLYKEKMAAEIKVFKEKSEEEKAELIKAGKEPKENVWGAIILPEFVKRNKEIYQSLLKSDYDVVIYVDMNKLANEQIMGPYIEPALQLGHDICSLVVNSFVFDPSRSDYSENTAKRYNLSMPRHVKDIKSEAGQIYAKSIKVGAREIKQHHDLTPDQVLALVSLPDQKSVSALNSGLVGTLLGGAKPFKQEGSEIAAILTAPASML